MTHQYFSTTPAVRYEENSMFFGVCGCTFSKVLIRLSYQGCKETLTLSTVLAIIAGFIF